MYNSLTGTDKPVCRWGNEVQTATVVSGPALQCLSPPAPIVPAVASFSYLHTLSDAPPASWRYGAAALRTDGELRLTTGEPTSAGSLLLPVRDSEGGYRGAVNASGLYFARFRVTWKMRVFSPCVGRECPTAGDGLSFSYGLLPPGAIGETGAGLGLRVSFLTAARCPPPHQLSGCPVVEVRYATELLARVPLDAEFRWTFFRTATIEYSWRGLYIAFAGVEYIKHGTLYIDDWAPTKSWSMGFGARSGLQTDVHEMRDLYGELGSLVDATTVPLHVSLNSQQYVAVDVAHMRCWDGCHGWSPDLGNPCGEQGHGPLSHAHTTRERCGREQGLYGPSAIGTEPMDAFGRTNGFVYYGAPNVTLISPTTGPTLGGPPALLLAGTGLHSYGGLHGGSHYRCRFGTATYTTATVSASLDEAYCVAPAGAARNDLPVALSLNGQQFHPAPSNYDRLASAEATRIAEGLPNIRTDPRRYLRHDHSAKPRVTQPRRRR